MQVVKKIYLSIFGVFFRAAGGEWSKNMNCWKGVLGVTLVEWALIMTVNIWVQLFTQINPLSLVGVIGFNILLILSVYVNYFILITRGTGVQYERKLAKLHVSQRRASATVGNAAIFVIIGILIISLYAFKSNSQ